MALIRHANARTMARDAIVLDLGDLAAQGALLKARARAEADQILENAKAERERMFNGAAEEGRRAGQAKGLEEGRKQGNEAGRAEALVAEREKLKKLDASWQAALASFEGDRDRMLLDARQDIVRLAAIVAEMVTKRSLVLEPERVTDQLGAVLSLLSKPTRLVVAVHPDDEPTLRDALPSIAARAGSSAHVEFTADATLERGSCIARTSGGGVIDASIRTQLQRITEVLLPGQSEPPAGGAGAIPLPPEPAP
jgi:flagellar biosynthesis/type III secretory pathway protein FliH